VIRSSADLLRGADLTQEKRRRYLDAIAQSADRIALVAERMKIVAGETMRDRDAAAGGG
jgi:nitrogen-specific signal transduction histidine kinase